MTLVRARVRPLRAACSTLSRRELLGTAMLGVLAACRAGPAASPEGAAPALHLDPLADLVPAAGLVWMLDARLEELLSSPVLAPAVAQLVPGARFDAFAARHGGVDLRHVSRLVLAGYADATLALARAPLQPGRIESAFAARALAVEGRAVEGGVTRIWGTVGGEREQVALFGDAAVGLERGRFGPLRAAEYFAQGKLHRARPALAVEPLARPAALLADAPARFFAPGPFAGEWAAGVGGLLRATTAVAIGAEPIPAGAAPAALAVQVLLLGAWGDEAPAAARRLGAAYQLLGGDSLGRLLGLDHPLEEPRVSGDAEALRLELRLDPMVLARGLHAATDATIDEIMAL